MRIRWAQRTGIALAIVVATLPAVAAPGSASAGAATSKSIATVTAQRNAPSASSSAVPALAPAGERATASAHDTPQATGENPPGRVTQTAGLAGYEVPTGSTATVSTEVTLPNVTCHSGTNPGFGDVVTSGPEVEVAIGFESTLDVSTVVLYNCGAADYAGFSTIEPTCTLKFGRGECYYEGFIGGTVSAGDRIELTASLSPTGTTSAIHDLTSGAHLTYTYGGVSVSSSSTVIGAEDFCFLAGGDSEPCSEDDGGSSAPPPGYASYAPYDFTDATVDGTGLGAYLAGPNSTGWVQINDVWGTTLEGQTTYVGSGSSFTDTNAQLQLPTLAVTSPRVDQPSSKDATLTFGATLSFASTYPIYLSYATSGGTAKAGTNYTPVSGTLEIPPGSTHESIPVTVLSGPEMESTGNVLTVDLVFSEPSYVAIGGKGVGTINEGPIVTSVSPSAVPLNGGPGTQLTVTGHDLGHVNKVEFCPTATAGGGTCITGTSIEIVNDTTLTVVAPDATTYLHANDPTLPTDTIVTDAQGVSSPIPNPATPIVETFGCETQVITDGAWQARGCMTDETGDRDVTEKQSQVDGAHISASATDQVTYLPASADVTSHGSVTVSLPLTKSTAVTIFKGKLAQALSGAVTFSVPSGTKVAGIGISGSLTLTPVSPGKASGSVTATLPAILGGGTGKLTFTTTTSGTLSNVSITVPKATFMQLFSLTTLHVAFNAPGTWELSATASTGGTTQTKFSGKLVYASNTLKSGTLAVSSISLAGMVTITNLKVTYGSNKWSGSAKLKQAKQSATIAITITGSTITSASFKTKTVPLFGYVDVKSFTLTYNGSKWSLSVASTLSGGASASASLTVSGGVISKASITLTKFALTPAVEIASASLSYAQKAPNAACTTVTGTEIWCGAWQIQLPQAKVVTGIGGTLAFADGQFQGASVDVTGSVPLLDGVFLTHLGARLHFNPTVVGGGAAISLGPRISGVSALSVAATLTRTFPSSGTGGKYEVSGTVTALKGSTHSLPLGSATITVPTSGATTITLTLGGKTGLTVSAFGATAKITGTVKGSFTSTTFRLSGTATITVPLFHTVKGGLKADNDGVAACGKDSSGSEVGFEYTWSTGSLKILDTKGCSEKGF
jgi:Calx-beta domain